MITTILIWIAGIVGALLVLGMIAVGLLIYAMTSFDEDECNEIDNYDPHVVDSARQAQYPKSARVSDMQEPMGL